jgi:hypothetical protein
MPGIPLFSQKPFSQDSNSQSSFAPENSVAPTTNGGGGGDEGTGGFDENAPMMMAGFGGGGGDFGVVDSMNGDDFGFLGGDFGGDYGGGEDDDQADFGKFNMGFEGGGMVEESDEQQVMWRGETRVIYFWQRPMNDDSTHQLPRNSRIVFS